MGVLPRARKFRVAAVFYSGMYEYDSSHAYLTLAEAQRFLDRPGTISQIEIKVEREDRAGEVRQRLSEYREALDLWNRVFRIAVERGDTKRIGAIERSIGLNHFFVGDFDEALAHYDAAIAAARQIGDGALEARVLIPKGSCLQAIGRPQ